MESVKKNFLYNIVYQILLIILPLITAPYVSRTLGATSVGIYSYINSIAYYFLIIAMLGISNYGNREIAAVRENKEKLSEKFSSIYTLQVMTFSISILIYVIYVLYIVTDNKLIYLIETIYILSGLLDISWLFFGLEKFKLTVTRNVIIKLLTIFTMFVFVHDTNDLWKYTLIMALGSLFSQLYLWRYVKREIVYKWLGFKKCFNNLKPILFLFIPVLAYSIYKVMDKIMLGNMTNYEQVGFYNNAEKIINIPMGIITALGTVMLPRMSNMIASGKKERSQDYIRISIKLVTILSSAIGFGLIGISSVFSVIFFGKEFAPCSSIISLLSITVFFISWANVVRTQYLIPNHYDKIYIISTICGAFTNFILNSILIPKFYANGAAIGTIFAEFVVMFLQMFLIRKEIHIYKYIYKYTPIIIIGIVMMLLVEKIGNVFGITLLTLIIQIVSGGIFFIIFTMIFMVYTKDEIWNIFYNIIKKVVKNKKVFNLLK